MVLPIYTYGSPILRQKTTTVEGDSPELQQLLDDMVETMKVASGVGLAAPQVGRKERLFVVDVSAAFEDDEEGEEPAPEIVTGPMAFINPELELIESEVEDFEEGCLSIPDVREDVTRPTTIRIRFRDRDFVQHELEVDGLLARVIQHEFDHLEGVLFIDRLSPLKRRLLRRRLRDMARGNVEAEYPIVTAT